MPEADNTGGSTVAGGTGQGAASAAGGTGQGATAGAGGSSQGAGAGATGGAGNSGSTVLSTVASGTDDRKGPTDWPENWRTLYTTDDKLLKQLERYASPKAALDALFEAKARISKGGLTPVLGDNPTDQEIKDWREANGIPQTPADYKLDPGGGRVIGETDKPLVDNFVKQMHSIHATPAMVNKALAAYYDIQDQLIADRQAKDETTRINVEEELRKEMGQDYRRNLNQINSLLDEAPSGVREAIFGARLADGTPLGSHPATLRWLTEIARTINPLSSVVPGAADPVSAIADELSTITKMMGDRNSDYWKGPKSAQLQQRYRELIDARDPATARKRA